MMKYEPEAMLIEHRCKLNNIRYEIMKSKLPAKEKLGYMESFVRTILETYSPSGIIACLEYDLERLHEREQELAL